MKKLSLLVIALCITCGSVSAQQALFGGQMPQSPEIHADKTVTFRCMAPSAQKVQITGDFLPTRKIDTPMGKFDAPGVADLTKNHYPFTYMETDGGHIWRNWRIYLGEFAQKIFK